MDTVNILSRIQFAVSTLFHFVFVDLTIGLGLVIALAETMYVITRNDLWKRTTQFWGVIFGLNFAMGASTGLPLEFQFGTNWAYYSHYVGDIFGSILAMEGLIAFFLESTLLGIFFFGWRLVSPVVHLICTWLLFLGANLSALFILIANGWMQNPIGATFSLNTMRMELRSFSEVFYNMVAQCKFFHTTAAGYVYGSAFVVGVSAYYVLKGRNLDFARKNFLLGSSIGLISSIAVVLLGDESGFVDAYSQPMKVAAIEAEWKTAEPPADFTAIGIPDRENRVTHFAIKIPKILGILATRSLTKEVPGIENLVIKNQDRIRNGILFVRAVRDLNNGNEEVGIIIEKYKSDYGYALLLKKYRIDIENATEEEILKAANDTVPNVFVLFWAFRVMVGLGFYFILFFAINLFMAIKNQSRKWMLWISMVTIPLPLLAAELGWIVAEMGRQPWAIQDILPTRLAGSALAVGDVAITLSVMVCLYSVLLALGLFFVIRHIVKNDV